MGKEIIFDRVEELFPVRVQEEWNNHCRERGKTGCPNPPNVWFEKDGRWWFECLQVACDEFSSAGNEEFGAILNNFNKERFQDIEYPDGEIPQACLDERDKYWFKETFEKACQKYFG